MSCYPEIVNRATWRPSGRNCWSGRRRTPARATRSPPRDGGCRWWRSTPRPRSSARTGPVPLLDVFEGRGQLIAYFHMWHAGTSAADQCEGCTFFNGQVRELAYLHSRDVTYATLCEGPYEESIRYRDFMGWDVPWYSAQDPSSPARLVAGRSPAQFVCYVRDGERVFETYWTTGRGIEQPMAPPTGCWT